MRSSAWMHLMSDGVHVQQNRHMFCRHATQGPDADAWQLRSTFLLSAAPRLQRAMQTCQERPLNQLSPFNGNPKPKVRQYIDHAAGTAGSQRLADRRVGQEVQLLK